ncbi:MAG: phosphoribosyltransferase [Parachlamydiaceae bacterium]
MYFFNRTEAGKALVKPLKAYKNNSQAVVFGLLRGGVPLAHVISKGLNIPLQILSVKKIGAPVQPELAIGAVCQDGIFFIHERLVAYFSISKEQMKETIAQHQKLALEKYKKFSVYLSPIDLKGKIAILVDDGLATGATMMASIQSAKNQGASKVVVAVPVASIDSFEQAKEMANEVVCLAIPEDFSAVGRFYRDFTQVEDEEVIEFLSD